MDLDAEIRKLVDEAVAAALASHDCGGGQRTKRRGVGARQHPDTAPPRTAYSVPEVAESLGLPVCQVRRLIANGEIAHFRVGKHVRIPAAELEAVAGGRA
ncbi:excisionase family DNA-binding protein [Pseudonocardia dioxanivorans]|jgi:excisionase family DNA binding protein|uniref:excisionase family DNA-binding protein n=1 Tax=Pseudonocardia dioxanivorans TaxID=240495 RepID=UPI000CD03BBF|nr:excisionase family DNA-binding protein [Pseudonocardia dioxanivorans]